MKKILKKLWIGLTVAAGAVLASCSSTDDVMDSIPYSRVLTPLNFKAEVVASTGTDVTFRWDAMQNAEAYELQIFESAEEPAYDSATPIETATVKPGQIPYTVSLEVDKTFYARVRGISSQVEPSKWAYPEANDRSIKTYAVRPSLNPVVVTRTESAVSLAWDDAGDKEDLTLVRVAPVLDSKESQDFPLTAAEIEACATTIEGLAAGTEYKLTLIYGQSGQRGYVTAWTRPEVGQAVKVNSVDAILQQIQGATGEVKLLVAYNDGTEYDFTSALTDPATGGVMSLSVGCALTIVGDESEEGKKPVITNVEFSLAGGASKLHLENLALNGKKSAGATISIASAPKVSAVEVVNCEIYDYTKGIYSTAAGVTAEVDKVLFSGVYAHDINADGTAGGDFIDIRNGGLTADVEVVNSTFYACARTFLRLSDNAKAGSVAVRNCTFNQVTATNTSSNNAGIFHIRQTTGAASVVCENCLFLNECSAGEASGAFVRMARNSADSFAPLCDNNYYYNVGEAWWVSKAIIPASGAEFSEAAGLAGGAMLSSDPCVNSDAGKFYLTDGTIVSKRVGDPRWWNASEPKVERASELEVVAGQKLWDFTDKKVFDTESVAANTIIDNIRIYAPAEIVITEGITFASAAAVSANGVPTSSALGFKASGYGSVTVTTTDGGYNASVHVVAGGDRITLPADGKPHKAIFGDLAGDNDIYVLAGSPVTVLQVAWTPEDVEAEDTKVALDAPKVSLSPTSITVGNAEGVEVVASWPAVDNAASYAVTFNGKTSEVTSPAFAIAAADAAALRVGEYEIAVVAKPVTTSTKFKASEAATATLNVKAKPAPGGQKTLTWDFASPEWAAVMADLIAAGSTGMTDYDQTVDGLRVYSGGGSMRAGEGYFQTGGKGSASQRAFSFTAPASGTLTVTASNTGGSEDLTRMVTVQIGDDAAGAKSQPGGYASGSQEPVSFDITVDGPTTVYIYPTGNGLRFYSMEFTYSDGSAAEPSVWDFASDDWKAAVADLAALGSNGSNDYDVTIEGLRVYSGGSSMRAGEGYYQTGGKGSAAGRAFSFTATSAGTLKVTASNTGGSEDLTRMVTVQLGDDAAGAKSQPGGYASGNQQTVEFDINVSEPTTVYIYPTGNGLRFYSMEFDGGVQK